MIIQIQSKNVLFKEKNEIGKHPTLFKFRNFKNFTLLFSEETFSVTRKFISKKERAKSEVVSVKNSDSNSEINVDIDTQ